MKKTYRIRRRRHGRNILRIAGRLLFLFSVCYAVYNLPYADNALGRVFRSLSGKEGVSELIIKTGLSAPYGEVLPTEKDDTVLSEMPDEAEENAIPQGKTAETLSDEEEDDGSVVKTTITGAGSSRYKESDGIYLNNKTKYALSADTAESPIRLTDDGVQVLIVHTHGSEAYHPSGDDVYVPSDPSRTEDTRYNVVRLGDELCEMLNANGIETVHDRSLYDYPTYTGSYGRSLEAVKSYLKKYPTIKVVLDIHRDALEGDGITYKTVTNIDGVGQCSQIMLVVGTDYNGLSHENWRENFSFAVMLQKSMAEKYPTLMRPLTISGSRYNQHLTSGSLIVEVGTNGNTLQESLRSVRLFGETLIETLG